MAANNFTVEEILQLKEGTLVRIKDEVDCFFVYHKGGTLVFQDDSEKPFGIRTMLGSNFDFSGSDYELIESAISLTDEEVQIVLNDFFISSSDKSS